MKKYLIAPLACGLIFTSFSVTAEEDMIARAMSAAPAAISAEAAIMKTDGTVLREGSNSWTCFPYFGSDPGQDPACGDAAWTGAFLAEASGEDFVPASAGVSYMLASGTPHLMILVPEAGGFEGFNQTPGDGKTWLMWGDRVGRHLMIPIEFEAEEEAEE